MGDDRTYAVLGAGGPLGLQCVSRLLELDCRVIAVVRNPGGVQEKRLLSPEGLWLAQRPLIAIINTFAVRMFVVDVLASSRGVTIGNCPAV